MEFDKLPIKIQDWLNSNQIPEGLKKIEEKYKIPDQEIYEVQRLIVLLVLGEITLPEFQQNIKNEIQADNHQALIKEIEGRIFNPVKQELQDLLMFYEKGEPLPSRQNNSLNKLPPTLNQGVSPKKSSLTPTEDKSRPEILQPSFQEKQQPPSPPKIVHYSDLRTPIKPAFAEKTSAPTIKDSTPETPTTPTNPADFTPNNQEPDSSPNQNSDRSNINRFNIVDLKDIPQ